MSQGCRDKRTLRPQFRAIDSRVMVQREVANDRVGLVDHSNIEFGHQNEDASFRHRQLRSRSVSVDKKTGCDARTEV
jgi:hypothetical protein